MEVFDKLGDGKSFTSFYVDIEVPDKFRDKGLTIINKII